MQAITETSIAVIDDIAPAEFARACWEAHPGVQAELAQYLETCVRHNSGALFATFDASGECTGRVAVEVHPGYTTRGKPCATFGWLDGENAGVVAALLYHASDWAVNQKIHINGAPRRNSLLRGPISFPKNLGGTGCQVEGFDLPRMVTVSTNRPALAGWIGQAGFALDAPYACIDISPAPNWKSQVNATKEFRLTAWEPDEWLAHEAEVRALVLTGFTGFLPDANAGRFHEMVDAFRIHPEGKYFAPVALDAEGTLAGFAMSQPNLWELWDGCKPTGFTGVNVDTALVRPEYQGRGISSALNGYGRAHLDRLGIKYYEGTSIWFANEQAVAKFFPHGKVVRKHAVFQKRLRNNPVPK